MDQISDCAIVISSCDAFQDAWKPFFTLFFRYWPDCPFPIHLISNYTRYDDPRVQMILVGEDKKLPANLRKSLESISQSHVLYLQEDYLLERPVDNKDVLRFYKIFLERKAAYFRLYPNPKPDIIDHSGDFGLISREARYRTSMQASFWDKAILLSLLRDEESGWDLEIKGTERSRTIERPFFCSTKLILPYIWVTGIKKGRWQYESIQLCKKEGIKLDLSKRPVESYQEYIWRRFSHLPVIGLLVRRIARRLS